MRTIALGALAIGAAITLSAFQPTPAKACILIGLPCENQTQNAESDAQSANALQAPGLEISRERVRVDEQQLRTSSKKRKYSRKRRHQIDKDAQPDNERDSVDTLTEQDKTLAAPATKSDQRANKTGGLSERDQAGKPAHTAAALPKPANENAAHQSFPIAANDAADSAGTSNQAHLVRVVDADDVNEIDLAAPPMPLSAARAALAANAPNAYAMSLTAEEDNRWDQASSIGKVFIVAGLFLTIASALRLLLAR